MDALLRFLNRPVHLRPAGPRARRALWLLLADWVLLNVTDWATTATVLAHAGSHEGNPFQAALLAAANRPDKTDGLPQSADDVPAQPPRVGYSGTPGVFKGGMPSSPAPHVNDHDNLPVG